MEIIRGKVSRQMSNEEMKVRVAGYSRIILDLGTGDGRYAAHVAQQQPSTLVIGVDACRENLDHYSRKGAQNLLFIIAEAQRLPPELNGLFAHVTINFPWGSLLESLLSADPVLMNRLECVSRPGASAGLRLNAGALDEAGTTLEMGARRIQGSLLRFGWMVDSPQVIDATGLRRLPSTWARRLAFGRDPRAVSINARLAK